MKTLTIKKDNQIENKWLTIKTKFKSGNFDLEEMNHLTSDLIAQLGGLTIKGYTSVNNTTIDKYKDRVWNVIENIGLLPEYTEDDSDEI